MIQRMGWSGFGKSLLGLVVANGVAALVGLVDSFFSIPIAAFDALASVAPAFFQGALVDPLAILSVGADASAQSLLGGFWTILGPFRFPLAALSVFAGYAVVKVGMDALDWDTPGWDIPGLSLFGNDDGET